MPTKKPRSRTDRSKPLPIRTIIVSVLSGAVTLGAFSIAYLQYRPATIKTVLGSIELGDAKAPPQRKADLKAPMAEERRVVALEARLEPMPHFFLISHGDYPNDLAETAMIHITLANVTSSPILLTGAHTEFKWAQLVRSSARGSGANVLSSSQGKSARILLQPGEEREVSLDKGVRLAGLAGALQAYSWMRTAHIFDDLTAGERKVPILADQRMLPEFNRLMGQLYGRTKIGVTIYEGNHGPVAYVDLPIADGVDFFYRADSGGPENPTLPVRFDHSSFLAQVMLDFRENGAGRGAPPIEPQAQALSALQ